MAYGWRWVGLGAVGISIAGGSAGVLVSSCASDQQPAGFDDGGDDSTTDDGGTIIANDGASEAEAAGTCPNNQCAPHFADCDKDAANGCEANLRWDIHNCGTCGDVCGDAGPDGAPLPYDAVPFCSDGGCDWYCAPIKNVGEVYKRCPTDAGDMCVFFPCDPNNCGDCNVVCPKDDAGNQVCSAGNCGCPFGTVDCDGVPECGYECKDLNTDPNNCGICGRKCPQDPALTPFHMAYTCNGPNPDGGLPDCTKTCIQQIGNLWLDCNGDMQQAPDAGDGCETFGWGSVTNCGACGNKCKPGDVCHPINPESIQQQCGCQSPLSYCPAYPWCRNLDTDPYNCGACDHVCPAAPHAKAICVGGKCGYECDFGFADCNADLPHPGDGCEIDILNNPDNCGGCTNHCDGGVGCGAHCAKNDQGQYIQRCQNGVCATQGCNNQ